MRKISIHITRPRLHTRRCLVRLWRPFSGSEGYTARRKRQITIRSSTLDCSTRYTFGCTRLYSATLVMYVLLNGFLGRFVSYIVIQALLLHVGDGASELTPSAIDALAHGRSSSLGTGGGTDHDDPSIRPRPNYRWEGLLEDPIRHQQIKSGWLAKLGVWLGITPLWREGMITRGIALDVKLENGRYVMISRTSNDS